MSALLVVDRALTQAEEQEIRSKEILDLRAGFTPGATPAMDAVIDWIDHAYQARISGQPVDSFFKLHGYSYWLHVRFRLFFDLYSHAQLLDRLPDIDVLSSIQRVYCDAATVHFWKHWTPRAERVLPEKPASQSGKSRVAIGSYISRLPGYLRQTFKARSNRWEGLFFSTSAYNLKEEGGLTDRQFGPVFDQFDRGNWLRVEFEALPDQTGRAPVAGPMEGKRLQQTASTTAVLSSFLLSHPLAAVQMMRDRKKLKKRFERALNLEHRFPFLHERWELLLHRSITRRAFSIAFYHLLRRTFEWLLQSARPDFVVATSENNTAGRLFVEASKSIDIPTFGVQHGVIESMSVDYRFSKDEAVGAYPDVFFTWGERTRRFLIKQSHYRPERTIAVGRLSDDQAAIPEPDPTVIEFGRACRKPILFFASQPQPNAKSRQLAAVQLAQFCKAHDLCCVVKLHPREADDGLYERSFGAVESHALFRVHNGELGAMVAACDFGSTCYSTVAWEVMQMRKPLILFDPLHLDLLELRSCRSIYHVGSSPESFSDWKSGLEEHLEACYALATDMLGEKDGKAAIRMMNVIRNQFVYSAERNDDS